MDETGCIFNDLWPLFHDHVFATFNVIQTLRCDCWKREFYALEDYKRITEQRWCLLHNFEEMNFDCTNIRWFFYQIYVWYLHIFNLARNSYFNICRMFPVNQENIILEVDTLLNKMTVQRRVGYSEEEIRCRCRGEEDTQKRRLLRNCFSSPNINHPSDCLGPSATLKNRTPRSCICLS